MHSEAQNPPSPSPSLYPQHEEDESFSLHPLNSGMANHPHSFFPHSLSQLLMGGLPGTDDLLSWIEQHLHPTTLMFPVDDDGGDHHNKQEMLLSRNKSWLDHGSVVNDDEIQTSNGGGSCNWYGGLAVSSSPPKSCITTTTTSNTSILHFSNKTKEDERDHETSNGGGSCNWYGGMAVSSSPPKSCITTTTTTSNTSILHFSNRTKEDERDHEQYQLHSPDQCDSIDTAGVFKKARVQSSSSAQPTLKVIRKEKVGDRIIALHQIVSPSGKTDTASVLAEATGYIRFLHAQIEALSAPYIRDNGSSNLRHQHQGSQEKANVDLKSRGLCLVPLSCTTHHIGNDIINGADYWTPSL